MTRLTAAILALPVLAACTLAPPYQRPEAPVAAAWPPAASVATQPTGGASWRSVLLDAPLRRIVELALANNRDLRIAAFNVEKFRAAYRIERSALLPSLNANAGATLQQLPETLSGTGRRETREQYAVGLGVPAWELDLFGRVRSLSDKAVQDYLATAEARNGTQTALIAAVADAWLTLAADREQLGLAEATVVSRQAALELVQKRCNAGVASDLDLQQALGGVAAAQVQQARYRRLAAQDENLLTLLLGAPLPTELQPPLLSAAPPQLAELAPGLPAETLLARPDVRAAEHRLLGAHASIGAARAAFFPRITLTGSLGLASDDLGALFESGAGTWSFVPQLTLPLFTAGRNLANLEAAKVEREIAVAQYEKAIQTAFREVADTLAARATLDAQLAAQQALADAAARTLQHAETRYAKGIDSYLAVLDAQRAAYAAQQELIAARLALLANRVTMYKVLGGNEG